MPRKFGFAPFLRLEALGLVELFAAHLAVRLAASYSYGLYSYGLYSYGLYKYGLYSYGLYSYGLYSHGLAAHPAVRLQRRSLPAVLP